MGSGLSRADLEGHMRDLAEGLFRNIPSGVGSHRKDFKLSQQDLRRVLEGARAGPWPRATALGVIWSILKKTVVYLGHNPRR